jgi:hypothetical protein
MLKPLLPCDECAVGTCLTPDSSQVPVSSEYSLQLSPSLVGGFGAYEVTMNCLIIVRVTNLCDSAQHHNLTLISGLSVACNLNLPSWMLLLWCRTLEWHAS